MAINGLNLSTFQKSPRYVKKMAQPHFVKLCLPIRARRLKVGLGLGQDQVRIRLGLAHLVRILKKNNISLKFYIEISIQYIYKNSVKKCGVGQKRHNKPTNKNITMEDFNFVPRCKLSEKTFRRNPNRHVRTKLKKL